MVRGAADTAHSWRALSGERQSKSSVADQPDICTPVQLSWGTPADTVSGFAENSFNAHSHVTLFCQ